MVTSRFSSLIIAVDTDHDDHKSLGDYNVQLETVSIAEPLQNRQHARETLNAVNTRRERE